MRRAVPVRSFPFAALAMVLCLCSTVHAAHPLITDDTGVQGAGKVQIEVNGEYGKDQRSAAGITEKATISQAAISLTYGATDSLDLALTLPYIQTRITQDGATVSDASGMSDLTFEAKWKFFEKDGLSFALKPGITASTGDEQQGLGTGRTTCSLFFISTKEIEPWAVHANLGYIRNQNDPVWVNEEKNLWHASIAAEFALSKKLRIVGNLGVEKNPEKGATDNPAFAILGVIYNITDDFEIDGGVKRGITDPEMDTTALAGLTVRF